VGTLAYDSGQAALKEAAVTELEATSLEKEAALTRRVIHLTLELARRLGVDEARLVHIRRGALLHDIGKLGVPDDILFKPASLAPEEWEVMKRHPELAYEMLSPISYLKPALAIPYYHHERWERVSDRPQG
jgi:HD-GYP domain-containing protein (c-di-GMP phosphodiesterase class II)